ncbi:ATPase [Sphingomonas mesophila]|uniref:F0F1 ATP synthase subunit B family protein n=1 Tax=Sphingomonas mesophila TaxID=2303576 RepID=UPI000E586538|nr:ATPase [Sphingomonas mesophila]
MPQLNQLAEVALSQFFWLAIVLGVIYFAIGKGMLPKIQSTVDLREQKIAADLAAAEAAQAEAEQVEEAYRLRMDASRAEAAKLTAKAKDSGAKSTEQTLGQADAEIGARVAQAEAEVRQAREGAVKDIEAAAAELAAEIARKVAGVEVDAAASRQAVKEVMANA